MKKIVEQSSESKVGEEKTLPVFHAKSKNKKTENLIKENQIVIDELLNDENTQMGEEKKVSPKVVEKSSKKEQAVLDGDKNQNADVAKDFDNQDESTENFESQQLSESTQVVARQRSKKKKILTFIFFIINLVVIAYIIIRQAMSGELSSIGKIMGEGNFKWGFFFLAAGVWGVMAFLDSVKTSRLIKQSSDRFRPFLAYKLNAIGRYYDNITPMATGGQPFQVYYLTNRGMSGGSALSVTISKYCLEQISSLIVCATAIIIAIVHFTSLNIISVASYVGFALNFTVFFVIFLVSVNQKIGKILIAKVFKLLYKLKIIKNYEKQYESVMRTVNNFQSTMKKFAKNIKSRTKNP